MVYGYLYRYDSDTETIDDPRKLIYNDDDFTTNNDDINTFTTNIKVGNDNSMVINFRLQSLQDENNTFTFVYDDINYFNYYTVSEAIRINRLNVYNSLIFNYKISQNPLVSDFDHF